MGAEDDRNISSLEGRGLDGRCSEGMRMCPQIGQVSQDGEGVVWRRVIPYRAQLGDWIARAPQNRTCAWDTKLGFGAPQKLIKEKRKKAKRTEA